MNTEVEYDRFDAERELGLAIVNIPDAGPDCLDVWNGLKQSESDLDPVEGFFGRGFLIWGAMN